MFSQISQLLNVEFWCLYEHEDRPQSCHNTCQLTFKYIWSKHLFKNNLRCALVGTKTSIERATMKANNTTTTAMNVYILLCSPNTTFMYFCGLMYIILVVEIVQIHAKIQIYLNPSYVFEIYVVKSRPR